MIGTKPKRKLRPVEKDSVRTLASWIRNEVELAVWSGNTFRKGFSVRRIIEHLGRKDLHSFAWLDDKENLLCYADLVREKKGVGILCRVIVHPERRGRGVGKAFCGELLSWAGNEGGFRKIHLNTFRRNKAATACYEALGFRTTLVKPRSRKVGGEWQDLVVMSLELASFRRKLKK